MGSRPVIVSTVNVNGIRAAIKERSAENLGLLPWLADTAADVVCLQETRAWRRVRYPPGSSGPRPMPCAGPTTRRSPSNTVKVRT
ncbi:endonuclease/exonuclease/phosphatase family protein [Mycobacterium sp. 2YAF39]|uniref:endonuclease/exonuclease/phosphatase family protein n=1 Tax=Mycobacterium sp. 2YAF39 TaxID=3233033 RepID=UPI003F95A364